MFGSSIYAVILAGGSGTRFWPKSRHLMPKQLCEIGSETETMIEMTLGRLESLIPPERRLIVTHIDQVEKTRDIVGERCHWYLAEPCSRNTGNAIAAAALEIKQHAAEAGTEPIMISLHADAIIKKEEAFVSALKQSVEVAKKGHLALLGIAPEYPETGYGYIEKGSMIDDNQFEFQVSSFREKPDRRTAEQYLKKGNFFWNAGIFSWKIETILAEFERWHPEILHTLRPLLDQKKSFSQVPQHLFAEVYRQLPNVTIDQGILERSRHVAVIPCSIGWQDVGSWDALDKCYSKNDDGNIIAADSLLFDCENTTVDSDGPFVGAIGLKDLVIVAAKGAILVCPKDRAQEVKKIVEKLKQDERGDLL